jgi:hypothetical protein
MEYLLILLFLFLWLAAMFFARRVTSLATAVLLGLFTWQPNTLGWLVIGVFLVLALIPHRHRKKDGDHKGLDMDDAVDDVSDR